MFSLYAQTPKGRISYLWSVKCCIHYSLKLTESSWCVTYFYDQIMIICQIKNQINTYFTCEAASFSFFYNPQAWSDKLIIFFNAAGKEYKQKSIMYNLALFLGKRILKRPGRWLQ